MAIEAPEKSTSTTATHTVVHYEIPATDAKKLTTFYSQVFGWQFGTAPGMDDYFMAETVKDGAGVAIFPKGEDTLAPRNYISVPSAKAFSKKIEEAGGKVVHEFSVPGMGHGAIALDPEGNAIGVWQSDPTATPA